MFTLFKRNPHKIAAARLYDQMQAAARVPAFYRDYAVPDTLDGRFGVLALHVFVVIFRLKNELGASMAAADQLAQAVFDAMFRDIEAGMREAGVGDLSVPRKIKQMMEAFNGACLAYTQALAPQEKENIPDRFKAVLLRNLYGVEAVGGEGVEPDLAPCVQALTEYALAVLQGLMATPYEEIMTRGVLALPDPESRKG